MVKVYIPNTSSISIGGGWTFIRNLKKALKDKIEFVDDWQQCDIYFIFSVTATDKTEFYKAKEAGKKIVMRVDNIPRRSRNTRMSPVERLAEFGKLASMVVYQSNWSKEYAGYHIDNKNYAIINNGVDTEIFNTEGRKSDGNTFLYINYNDNPNKRFDEAIYRFDLEWRKNKEIQLLIAGNVPRIYLEHPEYKFDLTVDADVSYVGIMKTPEETAELMKTCDYLLYPSFAEAYPNTVLEAMACGLKIESLNYEGGAGEVFSNSLTEVSGKYNIKTIQEMGAEYLIIFNNLMI